MYIGRNYTCTGVNSRFHKAHLIKPFKDRVPSFLGTINSLSESQIGVQGVAVGSRTGVGHGVRHYNKLFNHHSQGISHPPEPIRE